MKFCWILYAKWKIWQINFHCVFVFALATLNGSVVVETITFETETSLKLRDRDFVKNSETETWMSRPRLETSKFLNFAEIFQKMSPPLPKLNFFEFLAFFRLVFTVSYLQTQQRKNSLNYRVLLIHILAIFKVWRQ